MASFMSPDKFVMVCVVLVMLFFLIRAIFARITSGLSTDANRLEDYLFASKELSIRDIRESTAATYSTFATVFFWFVALGGMYSWLLFLIPLFLYFGNALFTIYVQKSGVQLREYSTIGSFLRQKSRYKPIHYLADWIIVVFLFSAILVEMVIGSGILASMIPSLPNGQLFFIMLLAGIVILYVVIGGFRAVILSDAVQLYLTLAGIIALLVFSTIYLPSPQSSKAFIYPPKVNWISFLAFVVSVIVVQIFGPPSQLQNWQRICGSEDQDAALKGHRQGALVGAGLWAMMIVAALILYVKLQGSVSFENIFEKMKVGGTFSAYALYPLLFVGFIAAMISSADSAMSALYLFLYDVFSRRRKLKGATFDPTIWHHLAVGAGFFLIILSVYWINKTNIQSLAISTIYFLYNQLLVTFPVLIFFIIKEQKIKYGKMQEMTSTNRQKVERNIAFSIGLGWLTVLIMTAIGHFSKSLNWIMFASGSGVAITWVLMIPSWNKLK